MTGCGRALRCWEGSALQCPIAVQVRWKKPFYPQTNLLGMTTGTGSKAEF